MSKITQYSRISHHTITGSMSATFSVPLSEDFTDGTWTGRDLALSEIGVNEDSKKVYIRIDDEVKEFQLAGGTSSAEPLSTTLAIGNTTGVNDIIINSGQVIKDTSGENNLNLNISDDVVLSANVQPVGPSAPASTIQLISPINGGGIELNSGLGDISVLNDIIIDTTQSIKSGNGSGKIELDGGGNSDTIDISTSSGGFNDRLLIDPNQNILGTGFIADHISIADTYNELMIIDGAINMLSTEPSTNNKGELFLRKYHSELKQTDNVNGITDTISVDPQGLGNGTGISSENITSGDSTTLYSTPAEIYMAASDGTSTLTSRVSSQPGIIYSDAYDGNINTLDIMSLDPLNGSYISSTDATSGNNSKIEINPYQTKIIVDDPTTPSQTNITSSPVTIDMIAFDGSTNAEMVITLNHILLKAESDTSSYIQLNQKISKSYQLQTLNATTTTMMSISTISNTGFTIKASLVGIKSDYTKVYGSEMYAVFKNNGGTLTQISTTDVTAKTDFATATSTIDFSGTDVRVRVTGEAATTINWNLQVEYMLVS